MPWNKSERTRPWSKLGREIRKLFDPSIILQIHCVAYRMDSQRGSTNLPRYWFTLDKEVIWDYPKQFLDAPISTDTDTRLEQVYPYGGFVWDLSDLLREYIDTPKDTVFNKVFEKDLWGFTDILKASDRRIGKRRLPELRKKLKNTAAQKIIDKRLSLAEYAGLSNGSKGENYPALFL
jgi:hypothetical protein